MTRLLAWVAAALVFACSDPVEVQHGTLTIDLRRDGSFVWPQGGDTRITISNELDDQRGFAGFELDIAGTTFTARNFTTDEAPRLDVPDTGRMAFTVRLVQDGRVVAEGPRDGSSSPGPSGGWKSTGHRTRRRRVSTGSAIPIRSATGSGAGRTGASPSRRKPPTTSTRRSGSRCTGKTSAPTSARRKHEGRDARVIPQPHTAPADCPERTPAPDRPCAPARSCGCALLPGWLAAPASTAATGRLLRRGGGLRDWVRAWRASPVSGAGPGPRPCRASIQVRCRRGRHRCTSRRHRSGRRRTRPVRSSGDRP